MPKLTGGCLCGQISFEADGDIAIMANCHCKDCKQITGAAFATLIFMNEADVKIAGETSSYEHSADSGSVMTKRFCPNCGSQMFGQGSARPGMIALRAGVINEQEHIKPKVNVFAASKLDCTILDPDIPAFDKMPG